MAGFRDPPNGAGILPAPGSRFNDMASYVTDTSSITNPVELGGFSYSSEDDVDDATSALTGLTGWTSGRPGGRVERGDHVSEVGAESEVSELGDESANFPLGAKSYRSYGSEVKFEIDNGSVEITSTNGDYNVSKKGGRNPLAPIPTGRKSSKSYGGVPPLSPTSSILSSASNVSNKSKKRDPVPQMRDPNMDDSESQMWEEDCNYDINPTLMFLVLESRDWAEVISLLDGKGLENKNDAWNLGSLFGGSKKKATDDTELTKKRKAELKTQSRTWIVRRERNGTLRWRMLPLHAALAFNAPFEVVLRLYHLYPGAVRCRNDQGMLPLHHCFKFGNEDKVLELLLDVFPEALTVVDDRGRSPVECTPKDGSDNERRSNILTLFTKFMVEMEKKELKGNVADSSASVSSGQSNKTEAPPEEEGGTLGAVPRYTNSNDYTPVIFNSIKSPKVEKKGEPEAPLSPKEKSGDRYATDGTEDSENKSSLGNGGMGLSPIPEEDETGVNALKSELLALGEKRGRKGLRKKLFGRKR